MPLEDLVEDDAVHEPPEADPEQDAGSADARDGFDRRPSRRRERFVTGCGPGGDAPLCPADPPVNDGHPGSGTPDGGNPGRVRTMYGLYWLIILAGIVLYLVVGVTVE
jgi:hypothetical protein